MKPAELDLHCFQKQIHVFKFETVSPHGNAFNTFANREDPDQAALIGAA